MALATSFNRESESLFRHTVAEVGPSAVTSGDKYRKGVVDLYLKYSLFAYLGPDSAPYEFIIFRKLAIITLITQN